MIINDLQKGWNNSLLSCFPTFSLNILSIYFFVFLCKFQTESEITEVLFYHDRNIKYHLSSCNSWHTSLSQSNGNLRSSVPYLYVQSKVNRKDSRYFALHLVGNCFVSIISIGNVVCFCLNMSSYIFDMTRTLIPLSLHWDTKAAGDTQ